jgi:outer membrane protein TolC
LGNGRAFGAASIRVESAKFGYRAGTSSVLDWLEAERTRFSAEQDRVAGEAQLIKDYVALHKSLELRW